MSKHRHGENEWHDAEQERAKLYRALRELAVTVIQVLKEEFRLSDEPTAFQIVQIDEENDMPQNNTIVQGQTGIFGLENLLPAGSSLAPGNLPVWSADDPEVEAGLVAPAGIIDGSQISCPVPATDTDTTFNLTANYTRSTDGVVVTKTIQVTILAAAPALDEPESFDIDQLS